MEKVATQYRYRGPLGLLADMGLHIWDLQHLAVNGVYLGLLSISIDDVVVGMGL